MIQQTLKATYIKVSVLKAQLEVIFGPGITVPRAINGMFELNIPSPLSKDQVQKIQDISYPPEPSYM